MLWSTLLFLGLAAAKPLLNKRWSDHAVKHAWARVPSGWELQGPAPADHAFSMRIGLKQHKVDDLITALYEVSDPVHERCVLISALAMRTHNTCTGTASISPRLR